MTKIAEFTHELVELSKRNREKPSITVSVGARVNRHLVNLLKETGIPISSVIESSLVYFFTLSDDEKVKFIHNYDVNKIDVEDLQVPKIVWEHMVANFEKVYGRNE